MESNEKGAIAKWLRRKIRNLFLFEGAGSNPAGVARVYFCSEWRGLRNSDIAGSMKLTHVVPSGVLDAS